MSTDNQNNTQQSQMQMSQVSYKEDQPIQYEYPSQKIGNKFNVSVASLGDLYKFPKNIEDQYDLLYERSIDQIKELKRHQRDPNTGRPSSSMIMKQKGKVNNVFLNPYSIHTEPSEKKLKKSRVVEVNYLHMATLPDSKKYSHVSNGIINPPQSTFSVKTIIETNLKNHEEDMGPTIIYPHRVRIHNISPENRTLKKNKTTTEMKKGTEEAKNTFMVVGEKINMTKALYSDNDAHVKFTQSNEVVYKPRALSSQKARKTLLVSEKFVGAVQDYFRSNEMKIPAKNSINDIENYAKNVEKTLDTFALNIERKKAKTSQGKYEDPFRKKLKKNKVMKPNPPKIYPVIDNNYQRNVEEKLSKLQIELRQIFDALSQQGSAKKGDDEKVKQMVTKAKELTSLISHLSNDVRKSKELHIKQKKENANAKVNSEGQNSTLKPKSSTQKKNIVEVSNLKINQSIQLDNLNISTMPNTQPQITESQMIQSTQQDQRKTINNVIISAINPVQESMINTVSINNDSIINTVQSSDKNKITQTTNNNNTHVAFNNSIKEQSVRQQQNYYDDRSMTLPNYNSTMPKFNEGQKTITNKSQLEFNPLFSYSKNVAQNPLHSSSNDPNITLNNYQVEASKIKMDAKHPILDDRFSAFNIEMPAQYYFEVSKDHEPNKEKEWFIRPHHTETFTPNENSIPDDVLNTKYISYYSSIEKKETKTRQQLLEEMIGETRGNIDQLQCDMFTKSQFDKDKKQLYSRLEKLKEEARKNYVPGQFLDKNKKNEKITDLLQSGEPKTFSEMFEGNEQIHQTNFAIDTFSKLRSEVRNKEHQILIHKRKEEYERIRPPKKNWYELKGAGFQEEMKRNKMVINAGPQYFEKIKQLSNNDLY